MSVVSVLLTTSAYDAVFGLMFNLVLVLILGQLLQPL